MKPIPSLSQARGPASISSRISTFKRTVALIGVLGLQSLALSTTALAGGPEYGGTAPSFSTKYATYYGTYSCSSCHTSVPSLNSYGTAYKTAVLALSSGRGLQANVGTALTSIESADADGDGYTNISEINKGTNAADAASKPSAAVALSSSQSAKSGTPTTVISYSVTVTNNGNLTDSFTLGVSVFSGQSWTPSITGTANNVAAAGTATITVNVTVDGAATAGQTSVARVTAASQANSSITATALDLTTTATAPTNSTRYVNASTGVNSGTCSSAGSPCKTITYAMSQAVAGNPGDLINVAPGTYNVGLGEIFPINLKSGVQLRSTSSPSDTIIDATGDSVKGGILTSTSNSSAAQVVEGFTFKGGINEVSQGGSSTGGGIKVLYASAAVSITRNIFDGNEARGYSADNTLGMTGGLGWGGALYVFSSIVNVTNNVFVANVARGGNGYTHFGTALTGNENGGQGYGGAIFFGGSGKITNNTFYNNSAIGGSGGGATGGTGNAGDAQNGAIWAAGNPAPSIDNNIFANNSASAGAGGTASAGALTSGNAPSIAKNLFFGNTVNGFPSAGDTVGTGSLTSDPLFASAPTNLRITTSSPAKAAGTSSGAPSTDLDGVTRPTPPAIGAFEPIVPGPTVVTSAATLVTVSGATLNGTVNPNGLSTTGFFAYGTTASYGSTTTSQSLGSGSSAVALGGGGIAGLACGTTYHFQARATNSLGTVNGADRTFTTSACPVTTPQLSVNDVSADEGNTGTKTFAFTVTLSPASGSTVTVSYATLDGTATAGSDYTSASGTLTFAAGESTKTVNVTVTGDTTAESNEGFGVVLSGPTLATLKRAVGLGVIKNDDASSAVSRPQPSWQEFFAVDTLETPYVGDFNGDNKIDIITFTRQNPNAIGDVYVALSDGAKFGANTKWHDFFAISTDESVVIGDYNGDGKDDIATWLGKTSRQIYVALSTGSGMLGETVWVNSIGTAASDLVFSGDVDGDGKDDLIAFARTEGKVYVALSDGTKFGTPTVWHNFFAVSTFERPRVADVNGDGKKDIVTFATDSPTAFGDVYVATSNGTQFVSLAGNANDSSKWHDFFAIRPTEEIRIGDLSGDGKDDFFTFLPPPFAQCYSVLSQGTSMADNVEWAEKVAPLLGAGDNVYVGDVNGDGKADIIIFAQKEGKVFVSLAP